jgi:threonine dehydratase
MESLRTFDAIQVTRAADRVRGLVGETPLVPFPAVQDPSPGASGPSGGIEVGPVELRLKLECLQETGSFKARGASNQLACLDAEGRAAGVVATSSGNHGQALAWAAQRAGVPATIFMPANAYPNKIEACRRQGADVVLLPTRAEAEAACAERVAAGAVLVHPYDAERTVEGAGTVGLEIARAWPEVDVVVFPVGGGGLISGSSLALRRELGDGVKIVGVEPEGAPTMTRGLAAGTPVDVEADTVVQGLCPLHSGALNIRIVTACVDLIETLPDGEILCAQARLVNEGGWVVEPAGAAAPAWVFAGRLPAEWSAGLDRPLRVCAVVSGGNPAPEQLDEIKRSGEGVGA